MTTVETHGKFYHVIYSKNDKKWHVKEVNSNDVIVYNTKEAAIQKAVELVQDIKGEARHIVIHKEDGTIENIKKFHVFKTE